MGRFVYSAMVSLDGFIEDPDGGIGWSEPDEEVHRHANAELERTGLVIMGRGLCQTMEPFWSDLVGNPTGVEHVDEFARIWAGKPKLVFSRTMTEVPGDAVLVRDLDPLWVGELREKVEGTISVGGAALASDLAAHGLVDEVEMINVPAVTGGGKPMLGPGFQGLGLSLIESRAFEGGSTASRYAVSAS